MPQTPAAATRLRNDPTLKILVADDSDDLRALVELVLKELGHEIVCAENGKVALRLLDERDFDVVITDMLMPEADGIEVITAARKRRPSAPVIVMTGGGQYVKPEYNLALAIRMGANAVLQKPFTPSQLVEVLRSVVAATGPA